MCECSYVSLITANIDVVLYSVRRIMSDHKLYLLRSKQRQPVLFLIAFYATDSCCNHRSRPLLAIKRMEVKSRPDAKAASVFCTMVAADGQRYINPAQTARSRVIFRCYLTY